MNCNRKGGWEYICGYQDPGGKGSALGVKVHKYLEWLKETPGALPDRTTEIGAIAAEALPHVAHLSLETGAQIEGQFWLEGRWKWTGFKDIVQPGVQAVDYKTSSDPDKWAKSVDDLLHDPQAALYAEHEFRRALPGTFTIDLLWLYLKTRRAYKAVPVRAEITREHAAKCFDALESYADEMQAAAWAAPDGPVERHQYVLNVLQPNYDHCDAYGGCPHQSRCNIPMFRERNKEPKMSMTLLERLQAMDALNGGAANGAPTELANPAPGPFADMVAAAPPPDTTPANPINPPARRGPGRPPGAKNVKKDEPIALVPAEMAPVAAPAAPLDRLGRSVQQSMRVEGYPVSDAAVRESAARILGPPAAAPTPGSYAAIKPAAPPPEVTATPIPTEHKIATLFVGCLPVADGASPTQFDAIVGKAKTMIGAPAYFANYGYKTNGMLLEAVQRIVQHEQPASLAVLDPRTPEAVLCLSYLRSIATVAVEALR